MRKVFLEGSLKYTCPWCGTEKEFKVSLDSRNGGSYSCMPHVKCEECSSGIELDCDLQYDFEGDEDLTV